MTRYTKKPITIDAFRYNIDSRPEWFMDHVTDKSVITYDDKCWINTLEGPIWAQKGDWIIKGVKGEIYPCKPDIFEASYAPESPAPVQAGQVDALAAFEWILERYFVESKDMKDELKERVEVVRCALLRPLDLKALKQDTLNAVNKSEMYGLDHHKVRVIEAAFDQYCPGLFKALDDLKRLKETVVISAADKGE